MISGEEAEVVGLKGLGWLVGEDELLEVFLGSSGLAESELRARAQEPELLGAVLDFILMDDAWVMRFCEAEQLPYDRLARARAALPGGEQVHWT